MELKNTEKRFTRKAVLEELGDKILTCDETREKWEAFEDWTIKGGFEANVDIRLGNGFSFPENFLPYHRRAAKWLIDHGFAQEDKSKFQPFTVEVNTPEEAAHLWHRLNQNDSKFSENYSSGVSIFGVEDIHGSPHNFWNRIDEEIKRQGGKNENSNR